PVMQFVYDSVCKLYALELYEDVSALLELSSAELAGLSQIQTANIASIAADSYFQCDNFTKSQEAFYRAITITKMLLKPPKELKFNEAELKYRLHRCLLKQGKREEAMGVLGSIAEEDMTPKVKSALARLYSVIDAREQKSSGVQTAANAIAYHRKVVEECPEAIDSLSFVVRSGVQSEDVTRWPGTAKEWLCAQEAIAAQNISKAIAILSVVANNNLKILIELGRLHYAMGERQKAAVQLQRAHNLDAGCSYSMDILAYILAQDDKLKELENLAATLMDSHESPEAWVAYAFLAKCQRKSDKALYFAQKACFMCESQVQPMAMLLKASVLMDKRKFDEAIQHVRDALVFSPNNFDLYETLVQAYLMQNKLQEARLAACNCRHQLGKDNARALYLCATVSAKDDATVKDAQKLLEKAISLSPHLLDAVFLLVELYDRTQNYEKAITLLKKQAETTVNSRLHRLLGDFLSKTNRPLDACHQYRLAVDGDPSAAKAMVALEGMPGMNTPDGLASVICPSAPRRRGAQQGDD
ncbi:Anaphase-promoting complex subunit 7, partial [Toxocara canis]